MGIEQYLHAAIGLLTQELRSRCVELVFEISQRRIEVIRDITLTGVTARNPLPGCFDGNQSSDGSARACDHDLLTLRYTRQKARQMALGFMNIDLHLMR